jgi:hypothetical protein
VIAIRIHSLEQARAALASSPRVLLVSPPALSVGVGWWREIQKAVGCEGVFDCGPSPGMALAALRAGIRQLWLDAEPATLAKIAGIAEQAGGRAELGGKVALDLLGVPDAGAAIREVLSRAGT